MTRETRYIYIFKYVCKRCGHIMYVPRKYSYCRPAGHIKHMYCPVCRALTAHRQKDEFNTRWHEPVDSEGQVM